MHFPNPAILKIILDAYLKKQQPQWDSTSETLIKIVKFVTFQTHLGETHKKTFFTNLTEKYLNTLKDDTEKWIEFCIHLDKSSKFYSSHISYYLDFLRNYILLHAMKDPDFSAALKSAKAPAEQAEKPTLQEIEQLAKELETLDVTKVEKELNEFFKNSIVPYDNTYASYELFNAAALPPPPAVEREKKTATETASVSKPRVVSVNPAPVAQVAASEVKNTERKNRWHNKGTSSASHAIFKPVPKKLSEAKSIHNQQNEMKSQRDMRSRRKRV